MKNSGEVQRPASRHLRHSVVARYARYSKVNHDFVQLCTTMSPRVSYGSGPAAATCAGTVKTARNRPTVMSDQSAGLCGPVTSPRPPPRKDERDEGDDDERGGGARRGGLRGGRRRDRLEHRSASPPVLAAAGRHHTPPGRHHDGGDHQLSVLRSSHHRHRIAHAHRAVLRSGSPPRDAVAAWCRARRAATVGRSCAGGRCRAAGR